MEKFTKLLTTTAIFVSLLLVTVLTFGQDNASNRPTRVTPQSQCVRVLVDDSGGTGSAGSGTYIAPLLVATCEHVVRDRSTNRCTVVFPNWETIPGTIIEVSKSPDVAIIKLDRPARGTRPVKPASLITGQPLSVQGYGNGAWMQQWGTLSDKEYSGSKDAGGIYREILGAHARSGDSGGPIFDTSGNYVGTLLASDHVGTYFTPAKLVFEIAGLRVVTVVVHRSGK